MPCMHCFVSEFKKLQEARTIIIICVYLWGNEGSDVLSVAQLPPRDSEDISGASVHTVNPDVGPESETPGRVADKPQDSQGNETFRNRTNNVVCDLIMLKKNYSLCL